METALSRIANPDISSDSPSPESSSPLAEGPWKIGTRELATRYVLAPLAGYTQLPLRLALRQLGGLGLATTDLVHATHLLGGSRQSRELIATDPFDNPLSVQIFGAQTAHLVSAARLLADLGFKGVDLNMGCPMAKVNGAGGGARLMCDGDNAIRLVEQVVASVPIAVTVKMRLGWDADSITAPYLARRFEQAGIAAITIHGRTRAQGFGGTVSREGIAAVVDAVQTIPIIGNGDVRTPEEARAMRRETGCTAVAIGRGAMLDPWIFRRLSIDNNAAGSDPTRDEQLAFLTCHVGEMLRLFGDRGWTLIRKFAAWYGARLGMPEDLEDRFRRLESDRQFHELLAELRDRQGLRTRPIPTALLKIPNGPIAHW